MKLLKVIEKNIRILLRSKVSTFVLVLSPLIVILLVGFSFSTDKFNLQVGVYSEKYTDLSNSLVDKLKADDYRVINFEKESLCIDSVKQGKAQACVLFPPDMIIANDKVNIIKFYVDQSKINLAYLVMSSLSTSVGESSSQISKDLTDKIVTTMLNTKKSLDTSKPALEDIKTGSLDIDTSSKDSVAVLNSIDLTPNAEITPDERTSKIAYYLDNLLTDSNDLIESGEKSIKNLDKWIVKPNGTAYLNNLEDKLIALNTSIRTNNNVTLKELMLLSQDINDTVNTLSQKLNNAKIVNEEVAGNLNSISESATALNLKAAAAQESVDSMISEIDSIKVTNAESIANPIMTEINTVAKTDNNLGFLFPSLIVMLVMFIGLILPSTLIIMEKNSKASFRIFTTPVKSRLFLMSTFITSLILISFQLIVIIFVSQIYFKINFMNSLSLLIVSGGVIMSFFIILGMLIGYLFNNEEMAMLAAISIGTVFLLLSGIIFPLESMPAYIAEKAKYNPFITSADLFRESILFSSGFNAMKDQLTYMLCLSFAVILIIILIKKYDRILFFLKRPIRARSKESYLVTLFDFGNRKAKTLAEFTIAVQNLTDDRFDSLLRQASFHEWLRFVYKHPILANKIEKLKTKKEIVEALVEELKILSLKK